MNFLQPMILMAMPLIGVPVLIHLINQYRHKTMNWGAMLFLKKARRMTTGTAKLRFWLILLMRTLAVAGLLFALSRPLASGWLGVTVGGSADTVIIVLDRSASMEQADLISGRTKREAALSKMDDLLRKTGRSTQIVLIESTTATPRQIESADQLQELPETSSTAAAADIAGMLESALDYMAAHQSGRTDIWVCSDLRRADWDLDSGRWDPIREELAAREAVRLYLLVYPETGADNLAVRISNLRRRQLGTHAELLLDLELDRDSEDQRPIDVPMEFVINGARSTVSVNMTSPRLVRRGFALPIDPKLESGQGRVELPSDANPQDNVFHFAFAEPPVRRSVVVAVNEQVGKFLRLAAATPSDSAFTYEAELMTPDRLAEVDWDEIALLIWQGPLPTGVDAKRLEEFEAQGRSLIFFPPVNPTSAKLFNARWTRWEAFEGDRGSSIQSWRDDLDLLRNTDSGAPLPVGQLQTYRFCGLDMDEQVMLAELPSGRPLVTRAITENGSVYFVGTLPLGGDSNLANEGVVIYVAIQRAINRALGRLGSARTAFAGGELPDLDQWKASAPSQSILLSDRPFQAGSYQQDDRWLAINRPPSEDDVSVVAEETIQERLAGVDYTLIRDDAGSEKQLANEVWRLFLVAMIVALFAEALLCMPDIETQRKTSNLPARQANAKTQVNALP